ncbi:MAG: hypothetical protein A2378_03560 [Candidatus Pacebacteria bacterium RIFOXYB1_FULL_44_10]|nr:MAG: hypothetical protein A2378_03560 [Candidatus Pacebacteria bacterium RIFOXYB1_FULL_44_10]HAX01622.1 hypothetical protein [Candidatus Paceibacterota bacterium]
MTLQIDNVTSFSIRHEEVDHFGASVILSSECQIFLKLSTMIESANPIVGQLFTSAVETV